MKNPWNLNFLSLSERKNMVLCSFWHDLWKVLCIPWGREHVLDPSKHHIFFISCHSLLWNRFFVWKPTLVTGRPAGNCICRSIMSSARYTVNQVSTRKTRRMLNEFQSFKISPYPNPLQLFENINNIFWSLFDSFKQIIMFRPPGESLQPAIHQHFTCNFVWYSTQKQPNNTF